MSLTVLFLIYSSILHAWKHEYKFLTKGTTRSGDEDSFSFDYTTNQSDDAAYNPGLVSNPGSATDVELARACQGSDFSVDDLLSQGLKRFTLNAKQRLVIEKVIWHLHIFGNNRFIGYRDDRKYVLYVGGNGGTGKTQIINALLFASRLLNLHQKCCVIGPESEFRDRGAFPLTRLTPPDSRPRSKGA